MTIDVLRNWNKTLYSHIAFEKRLQTAIKEARAPWLRFMNDLPEEDRRIFHWTHFRISDFGYERKTSGEDQRSERKAYFHFGERAIGQILASNKKAREFAKNEIVRDFLETQKELAITSDAPVLVIANQLEEYLPGIKAAIKANLDEAKVRSLVYFNPETGDAQEITTVDPHVDKSALTIQLFQDPREYVSEDGSKIKGGFQGRSWNGDYNVVQMIDQHGVTFPGRQIALWTNREFEDDRYIPGLIHQVPKLQLLDGQPLDARVAFIKFAYLPGTPIPEEIAGLRMHDIKKEYTNPRNRKIVHSLGSMLN
ncbi:hypothetical protein HOC01_06660 [archaeon]|jgi:hypothetical protein|nr:hypothetical protein [archaeon]MBT6697478.1 hypothetical protein [archaeon]